MTQTPLQSPLVDFNVVDTNFEKWAKPGQFSRTLSEGPKTILIKLLFC